MFAKLVLALIGVGSQIFSTSGSPYIKSTDFNLVLLHNNDMHGRFEEVESNTGTCQQAHRNNTCIGGMARTAHVIRAFRERAKNGTGPPVLYLNAGDTFVGTSWFSVFNWSIAGPFVNMLSPDALSLGNHEFDLTTAILAPFVRNLTSPVLAANLNFSLEPTLQDLINASTILEVNGRRIGIIGYLTPETTKISSVGNVIFEEEVPAIRREAEKLVALGVNIIIALGHSGYQMDQTIAREVEEVDVVIGGHTNTFLWNGAQPDSELVEDPYPKEVVQSSGKIVPVVQAYAYTKYLGVLNCTFNEEGDLTHFAGQPLLLSAEVPQEKDVLQLLEVFRPAIDALNTQIIGYSRVFLDGNSYTCRHQECNLGNLVTDALVSYATSESTQKWSGVPIGIYNGGGLRNSINPHPDTGALTRSDLLAVLPFGNQVIQLKLTGEDLYQAMEQMVRGNGETSFGEFPQVSGLRLELDMTQPAYSRVKSIKVRCGSCQIPVYEPLDMNQNYTLVTSSFLADGGDGITIFKEKSLMRDAMDLNDLDTVANYITKYSPVYPEVQGRIRFSNSSSESGGSTNKESAGYRNSISSILVVVGLFLTLWNY
ncbi:protein 5NUC-like [Anthonomus grandis grandis]|uniref:protein 5NUC-like n=1 Tax=Anthonomus grandis grandis TaxID=2921223 RepID=UPI002165725C|nr:protein 5NUC-like [Anthonomus grandis grandis]